MSELHTVTAVGPECEAEVQRGLLVGGRVPDHIFPWRRCGSTNGLTIYRGGTVCASCRAALIADEEEAEPEKGRGAMPDKPTGAPS